MLKLLKGKSIMPHTCEKNITLVIWINGAFAIISLVSAVSLIGVSVYSGKTLDNAVLIALLVQPMSVALSAMSNLVTHSNTNGEGSSVVNLAKDEAVKVEVTNPIENPVNVEETRGN